MFLCKQTTYHLQAPPPLVSAQVVTSSVSRAALLFLYRVIGYLTLNILLSVRQVNHRGAAPRQAVQEGVPQTLLSSLLVLEVVQGSFSYGQGTATRQRLTSFQLQDQIAYKDIIYIHIGLRSILSSIFFFYHQQRYPQPRRQFCPRHFEIIIGSSSNNNNNYNNNKQYSMPSFQTHY